MGLLNLEDCPDDELFVKLLDEQLSESERERLLAHADECRLHFDLLELLIEQHREKLPRSVGRYLIIKEIGHGNMCQVYLGQDQALGRQVAIKILQSHHDLLFDHQRGLRFMRNEACIMARLHHPNIVTIFDLVHWSEHQIGLICELVDGTPLDKLPLPLGAEQLFQIARGLAEGLRAAHEANILHRDIKPANAILSTTGVVKLLDLGLAKLHQDLEGPDAGVVSIDGRAQLLCLTRTGKTVGTPLYMAPELFADAPASVQSDIYSLGALLYELGTGQTPHEASSLEELAKCASQRDALPLAKGAPELPGRLCSIVDRCLSRAPEARFTSVEELLAALDSLEELGDTRDSVAAVTDAREQEKAAKSFWWRERWKSTLVLLIAALFLGLFLNGRTRSLDKVLVEQQRAMVRVPEEKSLQSPFLPAAAAPRPTTKKAELTLPIPKKPLTRTSRKPTRPPTDASPQPPGGTPTPKQDKESPSQPSERQPEMQESLAPDRSPVTVPPMKQELLW
jgi:serine/threonine protein kinase